MASDAPQRHTVPASQTHYDVDGLASPVPAFHEISVTSSNRAGTGDRSKTLRFSHSVKCMNSLFFLFIALFFVFKKNFKLNLQPISRRFARSDAALCSR